MLSQIDTNDFLEWTVLPCLTGVSDATEAGHTLVLMDTTFSLL